MDIVIKDCKYFIGQKIYIGGNNYYSQKKNEYQELTISTITFGKDYKVIHIEADVTFRNNKGITRAGKTEGFRGSEEYIFTELPNDGTVIYVDLY